MTYYATMSEAHQEACIYARPEDTFYETLTFTCSAWSEAVQVVHSDDDLQTPDGLYRHARFELVLPGLEAKVCGELVVRTGALPRAVHRLLTTAGLTAAPIYVRYRRYMAANAPADMTLPLPLEVYRVDHTHGGAEIVARVNNLTELPFPRKLYSALESPGLMT